MLALVTSALVLASSALAGQASRLAASPLRATRGFCMSVDAAATKTPSFVQTEMRGAAMKLHTRDQAPKEGQQPAQKPVSTWQPGRAEYLQFLVDSKAVYSCLDAIVASTPALATLSNSGLERTEALDKDIAWFAEEGIETPPVATPGLSYVEMLEKMAEEGKAEPFVCHFYNHYFAHTAGGLMIGKRMADMLLDGRTLEFYKWDAGDPKAELLPALRAKIDALADTWTREQKDACLAETAGSFRYSGSLLSHLREPPSDE